jgi:glycosyltransferase involved in cell wall biosynthesis
MRATHTVFATSENCAVQNPTYGGRLYRKTRRKSERTNLNKQQSSTLSARDHMPLVSVFMKSYNHERFISEAIESVLSQDFEDLELIVVDDASTDGSRSLVERHARQDHRIRTIFHQRNLGITRVVNDGIDAATGKYIAQIDSDDLWVNSKLRKQLAVLECNENLVVWSEGEVVDQHGYPLGMTFSELVRSTTKAKNGALFQTLLAGNYIFGSSLMYKKANLDGLRYDERLLYNNDYKFLLELARICEFYYIAEPLAKYRIHGKNTLVGSGAAASKRRRRAYAEEIWIRQEALQRHSREISDGTKAEIYASLGFCHLELGERREAIRSYLQAIKHNPHSWSNLAYVARFFEKGLIGSLDPRAWRRA